MLLSFEWEILSVNTSFVTSKIITTILCNDNFTSSYTNIELIYKFRNIFKYLFERLYITVGHIDNWGFHYILIVCRMYKNTYDHT